MNTTTIESGPLACDLTLIATADREQHVGVTVPAIFGAAQEVCELPNGYAFRLPNAPGMFLALAQFVENERLCCPFFGFALEVEQHSGPLWLRLTGSQEAKQLLETIRDAHVDQAVLKQQIHTGDDDHLDEVVAQTVATLAGTLQKSSISS